MPELRLEAINKRRREANAVPGAVSALMLL